MSIFSFSLKSAFNATNNPTTDGIFSWGKLSGSTFTLANQYGYLTGSPTPILPYDSSRILAWNVSGDFYPHIGFENITPNVNITPQPFPNFGIYMHPGGSRACVRVTMPFAMNASVDAKVRRATSDGNQIQFDVLKNNVNIYNQLISSLNGTVNVNLPSTSYIAGETLDFSVGARDSTDNDDTALEVTFNFEVTKLSTPIISTSSIDCTTLAINGSALFVPTGTVANLYSSDGVTLLTSSPVTNIGYTGTFSISPLNLGNLGGQNVIVRLENGIDTPSDDVTLTVNNVGCEEPTVVNSPTFNTISLCKKKCNYQRKVTGTADFDGFVALYRAPMNPLGGNELVGTARIIGGVWEASNELIIPNQKYVAYGVRLDGLTGGTVAITSTVCDKECVLIGTLKGNANGINNGIVILYDDLNVAQATGIIKNGKWCIVEPVDSDKDYYLVAISLS